MKSRGDCHLRGGVHEESPLTCGRTRHEHHLDSEEKAAGFAEIMRRLRNRMPEELVLMAADTELALAECRILGEGLLADLEERQRSGSAETLERGDG